MKIQYIAFLVLFSACGKSSTTGSVVTTAGDLGGVATIQANSTVIADVLTLGANVAEIYIPGPNVYSSIYLSTGIYVQSLVYYAGTNCTGIAQADGFIGTFGHSVTFANNQYLLVGEQATTAFSYASYWNTSTASCVNTGGVTNPNYVGSVLATTTVTTQPYNFAQLAPISLSF